MAHAATHIDSQAQHPDVRKSPGFRSLLLTVTFNESALTAPILAEPAIGMSGKIHRISLLYDPMEPPLVGRSFQVAILIHDGGAWLPSHV